MLNQKRYPTLMADPPLDVGQTSNKGAIMHYPLMSLEQIKAMPVADFAADNAHLWLWTYPSALRHSQEIVEAWGFVQKNLFCWVKPRLGLGQYLRNACEIMLFAVRGKAPVLFKGQPNWGFFPVQNHSHKPEEQYAVIERVSPGPYLELFARRRQPGWAAWGNEIPDSDIVIPGFPVPSDDNWKEA